MWRYNEICYEHGNQVEVHYALLKAGKETACLALTNTALSLGAIVCVQWVIA